MKKLFTLILLFSLVMHPFMAHAAIKNYSWYQIAPSSLYITRGYVAQLLVNSVNVNTSGYSGCYSDVNGHAYEHAICYLVSLNVLNSRSTHFYPNNLVTRAEVAQLFISFYIDHHNPPIGYPQTVGNYYPDVLLNAWYYYPVNLLYDFGISDAVPGSNFNPEQSLTKVTAKKWIDNAVAHGYNI